MNLDFSETELHSRNSLFLIYPYFQIMAFHSPTLEKREFTRVPPTWLVLVLNIPCCFSPERHIHSLDKLLHSRIQHMPSEEKGVPKMDSHCWTSIFILLSSHWWQPGNSSLSGWLSRIFKQIFICWQLFSNCPQWENWSDYLVCHYSK